jgi:hypothetical protein
MPGDIFGLRTNSNKIYDKQAEDNWPASSNYGYYAGGNPSTNIIRRIDFSNETITSPGKNLPQARYGGAAVRSSNYGYFGAGFAPPFVVTVDRIDFSNETTSAPGNNLSQLRNNLGAVSDGANYGYFAGGYYFPGSPFYRSTVDRLDFSSETVSSGNNLSQVNGYLEGVSASDYGYFGGGASAYSVIDRLDFSNGTIISPGNNLPQGRQQLSTVSSLSYGYFAGGLAPSPTNSVSTVDRIDFSNETTSAPGNNLSVVRYDIGDNTFTLNYGYFAGGYNSALTPSGTKYDIIERIDFNNETMSLPGNDLPAVNYAMMGVSDGKSISAKGFKKHKTDISGNPIAKSYGYFAGGFYSPPAVNKSTFDRIDFSSETIAGPPVHGLTLPEKRNSLAAVSSLNYGYFAGGDDYGVVDIIERIDFSNETMSLPGNNLPQAKEGMIAVSNSNYGYLAGGYKFPPATAYDTLNRIDLTHETISVPGNNLPNGRSYGAGVFTPNYGYFGGGGLGPGVTMTCTIDRIDFSTEIISDATGNGLPQARSNIGSVFSSNYGYFGGGGYPYVNTMRKIDFSNEAVGAASNNLPVAREGLAGVSNANYGYFGGGGHPYKNTVDKIEFSNETTSASGNNLTASRKQLAAVSV